MEGIPQKFVQRYIRGNYRVVGKFKHTSMKPCHWLEQKLQTGRNNRNCYKGYWGIKSETCIQNSPAYPFCNHNCIFCWRIPEQNFGTEFNCLADDPKFLVSELIRHHKNLIEYSYKISDNLQNYEFMRVILEYIWNEIKREHISSLNSIKRRLISLSDNSDANSYSNSKFDYKSSLKNADDNSAYGENNFINDEEQKYALGRAFTKKQFTFEELLERLKQKSVPITINKLEKALVLLKNTQVLERVNPNKYFISNIALSEMIQHEDASKLLDKFVTNPADIKNVYKSAMKPCHAAISLDGEPMLYPYIGEFVAEFRRRGFTTFIVTNGTQPDVIKKLNENGMLPTILYVTLPPPVKNYYSKIFRPRIKGTWDKIRETLSQLKNLKIRTVLRLTSVRNLNLKEELIKGYVDVVKEAQPDFLDLKAFTLEGAAMDISIRLGSKQPGSYYVPTFLELENYAKKICELSNGEFEIIREHVASKDILIRVAWPKNKEILIQDYEK
ncbi:MAG: radical SAM protein [Promethearchaeota archaeon]